MKLKVRSIVLLFLFLNVFSNEQIFGSSYTNILLDTTKTNYPTSGSRAILVNIDPLFDYVGNMFNGSVYNSLFLNSLGLRYRKYKDKNKVNRLTADIRISSIQFENETDSETFPTNLYNGTNRNTSINLRMLKGFENHLNFNKLSVYYGAQYGCSLNFFMTNYNYEFEDGEFIMDAYGIQAERLRTSNKYFYATASLEGILGMDYYFSKRFFINLEMKLPFVLRYDIIFRDVKEEIEVLGFGNKLTTQKIESERKPIHLFDVSISNFNLIAIYAGFVF